MCVDDVAESICWSVPRHAAGSAPAPVMSGAPAAAVPRARGLHSSSFRLNLSVFPGIGVHLEVV